MLHCYWRRPGQSPSKSNCKARPIIFFRVYGWVDGGVKLRSSAVAKTTRASTAYCSLSGLSDGMLEFNGCVNLSPATIQWPLNATSDRISAHVFDCSYQEPPPKFLFNAQARSLKNPVFTLELRGVGPNKEIVFRPKATARSCRELNFFFRCLQ